MVAKSFISYSKRLQMKKNPGLYVSDRRKFVRDASLMLVTASLAAAPLTLFSCQSGSSSEQQQATKTSDRWGGSQRSDRKLGIALVGLGSYSAGQLAPALQETNKCYLAGIVTGTPSKVGEWRRRYNIPEKNVYNYQTFDQIKNNPDIDIIYIVLPNGMHAEYTIRAAQAGKHVICEKPMATSVEDCQRMIAACRENGVKLSIGYRLHFEPHNLRVMELGQQEIYGPVRKIESANSFVIGSNSNSWRVDKELAGGGPLMDMGIYCVQGANYTVGQEPIAVSASFGEVTRPDTFKEVEQSISWKMEYPNGAIAACSSSYNDRASMLYTEAERGWWRLNPAYSYSGIKGISSEGTIDYPQVNQQALQMDDFARCVLENRESRVPGEMGLRDVRILMAIYRAARTGKRVSLS